jgi:hypothetical protein
VETLARTLAATGSAIPIFRISFDLEFYAADALLEGVHVLIEAGQGIE